MARKYIVIAKVDRAGKFVKYRSNNLTNFFNFLLKKYPNALYANVFCNIGSNKGQQIGSWGKNKGLHLN